MGLKAIGNTIKNPIVKKFGNTMKNSMNLLCRNKNTIKTLAYNLEKKYFIASNKLGSKSAKLLGGQGVVNFKRMAP